MQSRGSRAGVQVVSRVSILSLQKHLQEGRKKDFFFKDSLFFYFFPLSPAGEEIHTCFLEECSDSTAVKV